MDLSKHISFNIYLDGGGGPPPPYPYHLKGNGTTISDKQAETDLESQAWKTAAAFFASTNKFCVVDS